ESPTKRFLPLPLSSLSFPSPLPLLTFIQTLHIYNLIAQMSESSTEDLKSIRKEDEITFIQNWRDRCETLRVERAKNAKVASLHTLSPLIVSIDRMLVAQAQGLDGLNTETLSNSTE